MKRKEKTTLAVIGTLIISLIALPVVITVIGGFLETYKRKEVYYPTQNPLKISEDTNWQEYKDEESGFKIDYPAEVYPAETPIEGYTATFFLMALRKYEVPSEIQPRIQIYKSEMPIDAFLKEANENRNEEQFPEFSKIELNDYEVYQTNASDPEIIFTHTLIGNDKKSYLIELFTIEKENDALKEIYNKMVSSFRIL